MKRLLPQHHIKLSSKQGESGSGSVVYFLPVADLNVSKTIDISEEDQKSFSLFLDFIQVCNDSVIKEWEYKTRNNMKQVDKDVVDDFIDIESDKEIT